MIKNNLSKIMGELRISQQDVAENSGLGTATIQRLYNDKTDGVNFNTLNQICKGLNKIILVKNQIAGFPIYKKVNTQDVFPYIDEEELINNNNESTENESIIKYSEKKTLTSLKAS